MITFLQDVRNLFTTADEGLVKMLQETTEKNLVKSSKKTEEHTAANIQIIDESIQCTSDGLQKVETETKKLKECVSKCGGLNIIKVFLLRLRKTRKIEQP